MARIGKFITGHTPLSAGQLNQLVDASNAFLGMRVIGGSFSAHGDFATLVIDPPAVDGAGAPAKFPFAIIKANQGTAQRIRIRLGTVNGIVPTAGALPISHANHFLPISASCVVYLRASVSEDLGTFGNLTGVEVLRGAALPDSTFAHPVIRIGSVTVTDGRISAIAQDLFASLQLVRFFQHYIWVPGGPAAAP